MEKKTALITGAASGIGLACAKKMAAEGYAVVVADINVAAAEAAAQELRTAGYEAMAVVMDVAGALYYVSQDKGALTGQSLRLTHGWAMM